MKDGGRRAALAIFSMLARRVTAALLCLAFASSSFGDDSPLPEQTQLGKRNWSITASPNLASHPPSKKTVAAFVRAMQEAIDGESSIGDGEEVSEYQFAPMRHNGSFSLVFMTCVTDRPCIGGFSVVDRSAFGFQMYSSGGDGYRVSDLRHDGNLEFVVHQALGSIEPNGCDATWPVIYAWTGAGYSNVSDRFREFYEQRLTHLAKVIPTLGAVPGPEGYDVRERECLEAEVGKLKRFLGTSRNAGVEQAERLAAGQNPAERAFAVDLFYDIATPKAREYLTQLATDPDANVSINATRCLKQKPISPSSSFTSYPAVQ